MRNERIHITSGLIQLLGTVKLLGLVVRFNSIFVIGI